jgi:predicted protein tyrosine phosphatase
MNWIERERNASISRSILSSEAALVSSIHVCSLSKLAQTVESVGARTLVTLIDEGFAVPRPSAIAPERHLIISLSDVVEETAGCVRPHAGHIDDLLNFLTGWTRAEPLVVHCWAGVSRSTAAAFIATCALEPETPERFFARSIRANSPTASPNLRRVELADARLGRGGRMVAAIAAIGRGRPCDEARSFTFALSEGRAARPGDHRMRERRR